MNFLEQRFHRSRATISYFFKVPQKCFIKPSGIVFNPFHTTGLFLNSLKTLEKWRFCNVFRVYRRRPWRVAWNRLINLLVKAWNLTWLRELCWPSWILLEGTWKKRENFICVYFCFYTCIYVWWDLAYNLANIYLLKVSNWDFWTMCGICSKPTIVTPERCRRHYLGVLFLNFKEISHIVEVFSLWTLNK